MNIYMFKNMKSIYIKLLLSFTIITVLLILTLSTFLYYNYSRSTLNIINKSNQKILSQISYSASYMNNLARNFCKTAFLSNNIIPLIYSDYEDMFAMGNSIRNLDILIIPNSYIQSVYTYNRKLDLYISTETNSFCNSTDFSDKGIVEIINNIKNGSQILVPIPRRIPASNTNNNPMEYINVYTYLMYDAPGSSRKIEGAVILNIKSDWLRETISSLDSSEYKNNDIFIVDKNGTVISHSLPEKFLKDVSKEKYMRRILSSDKNSDIFVETIDNKKYAVTYVSSNLLNWRFVSLTPYQLIVSSVQRVKVTAFVFCAIVLLLGLFFSIILSRKIYSPISTLVNNIKRKLSSGALAETSTDEMKYLSSVFSQMIEKADELEKQKRNNIQSLKNEFLKGILIGNYSSSHEDMANRVEELGINLNFKGKIFLFILKIDSYKHFMENIDERDRVLYRFAISNITNEVTAEYFNNEVVDMDDHLAVVLNITGDAIQAEDEFNSTVRSIIIEIQKHAQNYFNISLSAAAGYVIDNSDQLNGMYGDTLNILMYRIKYGRSCIIFPSILNQINSDNFQFPASKEKILMDSLKLGDFERAKNAYFEIVSIISNYSYDNIMASIIYLTFTVYNSLNNIMANSSVRFSAIFNTFLSHIGNLETLDEINQMFVNLFEEIIGKLNKAKGKKSDSIVNNVIRLINNSYYDKNLCLNSIADFMAMSPVYLGKLFKDVTSKSVAEYIMDLRMEKVKQLLDTGNLSINEILDKSGLEKTNYFYTTFKKHFGVSLGDYKLQQRGVNKNG